MGGGQAAVQARKSAVGLFIRLCTESQEVIDRFVRIRKCCRPERSLARVWSGLGFFTAGSPLAARFQQGCRRQPGSFSYQPSRPGRCCGDLQLAHINKLIGLSPQEPARDGEPFRAAGVCFPSGASQARLDPVPVPNALFHPDVSRVVQRARNRFGRRCTDGRAGTDGEVEAGGIDALPGLEGQLLRLSCAICMANPRFHPDVASPARVFSSRATRIQPVRILLKETAALLSVPRPTGGGAVGTIQTDSFGGSYPSTQITSKSHPMPARRNRHASRRCVRFRGQSLDRWQHHLGRLLSREPDRCEESSLSSDRICG